jgi:signal transduction histidine kinase/ligand-binding sensor domain-containing protein/DNA-binding NarL/FixJ family response regulator
MLIPVVFNAVAIFVLCRCAGIGLNIRRAERRSLNTEPFGYKSFFPLLFIGLLLYNSASASAFSRFDFQKVDVALPQNSVLTMVQDQRDYLWLGTGTGLVRYDGKHSEIFLHDADDPYSLPQNMVHKLLLASDGSLWIGTANGVSQYREGRFFNYLQQDGATERSQNFFYSIEEDSAGTLWVAGNDGVYWFDKEQNTFLPLLHQGKQLTRVFKLSKQGSKVFVAGDSGLLAVDSHSKSIEILAAKPVIDWVQLSATQIWLLSGDYSKTQLFKKTGQELSFINATGDIQRLFVGVDKTLWLSGNDGLAQLTAEGKIIPFELGGKSFGSYAVHDMFNSSHGHVLISSTAGIFSYDTKTKQFVPVSIDDSGLTSVVERFYQLRDGTIWLSTGQSGLYKWSPNAVKFTHYNPEKADSLSSIGGRGVRAVLEEKYQGQHFVWIGTASIIKRLTLAKDGVSVLKTEYFPLSDDAALYLDVHAFFRLADGRFLVSTTEGIVELSAVSNQTRRAPLNDVLKSVEAKAALNEPLHVLDIQRSASCIWITTNAGFGCIADDLSSVLQWYGPSDYPELAGNWLYRMTIARNGDFWLSSTKGLIRFNPLTLYLNMFQSGGVNSLSHNWVHGVWQQDDSIFWVATREGGLNKLVLDKDGNANWQRFGRRDGLPSDVIYAVLGDAEGNLWCSSSEGIFRLNPNTWGVRSYKLRDGLQSNEFNFSVSHIGPSGRLFFGGVNGVNAFFPSMVVDNAVAPKVGLVAVTVNEHPLSSAFESAQSFEFTHDQNHLAFFFRGLHFVDPDAVRYSYTLKGVDTDWSSAVAEDYARYGALPAGNYSFWVKAQNPDGYWSDPAKLFEFKILPHPLLTLWALLFYVVTVVFCVSLYVFRQRKKQKWLQQEIVLGVERELGLTRHLKLQFEHTAHELRTPIINLGVRLQMAMEAVAAGDSQAGQQHLLSVKQRVKDMEDIVSSHLLIEEMKLDANLQITNLAAKPAVERTIARFRALQNTEQQVVSELMDVWVKTLPGVIELILSNLLSNALKYGALNITVSLSSTSESVVLTVTDDGDGIATDDQKLIFLKHYRCLQHENIEGTGNGLFQVKACLDDIGGEIRLHSERGLGAEFVVKLPLGLKPESWTNHDEKPSISAQEIRNSGDKCFPPKLLLVEDNLQLQESMQQLLSRHYSCSVLNSVEHAFDYIKLHQPELVITDVMMEVPDSGLQLLAQLKNSAETSHIPVVLYSALGDQSSIARGYEMLADVYVTKSSDPEVLLAAVKNVIQQRVIQTRQFSQALQLVSNKQSQGGNNVIQRKLESIFDKCYTNPSTRLEDIANEFCKSPSQLNRIVKELYGVTAMDALLRYRLEKAKWMLVDHDCLLSVEAISSECGFGSIKTLQRQFQTYLGLSPTEYRNKNRV